MELIIALGNDLLPSSSSPSLKNISVPPRNTLGINVDTRGYSYFSKSNLIALAVWVPTLIVVNTLPSSLRTDNEALLNVAFEFPNT